MGAARRRHRDAIGSDSLTQSRANLWRYPPGAHGKRHADNVQEEVFVVLDGTLTVDLGEPPERHELERGSVLVVQPDDPAAAKRGRRRARPLIYGAPPISEGADFFDDVRTSWRAATQLARSNTSSPSAHRPARCRPPRSPPRAGVASGFSTSRWIARFSGRAP